VQGSEVDRHISPLCKMNVVSTMPAGAKILTHNAGNGLPVERSMTTAMSRKLVLLLLVFPAVGNRSGNCRGLTRQFGRIIVVTH